MTNKTGLRNNSIFLLLTIIIVIIAYSPVLKASFLNWDDKYHIQENPLTAHLSLANTVNTFKSTVLNTYVPLTILSFTLERHFFGLNPLVFHLNNLLLHVFITVLIFFFSQKLGLTKRGAFFAALIFGVHPLHVESVAWITERKDLLYALFYLFSLFYYRSFLQKKAWRFYFISLFFGLLSVLAKPMALSLPWILLLLNFLENKKWRWRNILDKIPFFIVVESIAWITFSLNTHSAPLNWAEGPLIWIWSASFYIQKFIFPYPLSPLYILPEPVALSNPIYIKSLLIFTLFLLSLFRFRKNRWWLFASLFYIGSTFFLWRFGRLDTSIVADRFMYLPCLGFCLFIALSLDRYFQAATNPSSEKIFLAGILVFVTSILVFLTYNQSATWQNDASLWKAVIKKYPNNTIAYNNMGELFSREKKYEEALKFFYKAVASNPRNKEAYYNIGFAETMLGRFETGLDFFNKTIALDPDFAKAYSNRGFIHFHINQDPERALEDYNKALALNPNISKALLSRGLIYDRVKKDYALALADFDKAIALDNTNPEGYNYRGSLRSEILKEHKKAIQDFTQAVTLDPSYAEAFMNRGLVYIKLKDFEKALSDLTRSIELFPSFFEAYINRGSLYREMALQEEALKDYSRAIELLPDNIIGLSLRAETFLETKRPLLALKDSNQILEKAPRDAKGYYLRSICHERLDQPGQALEDAAKAASLGFPVDAAYLSALKKRLPVSNK